MACPQCGCRVPARLRPTSALLVCADCGTPLPEPSRSERRTGWLGLAAVGCAALLTTGVVIVSSVNSDAPSVADRSEAAPVTSAGAAE